MSVKPGNTRAHPLEVEKYLLGLHFPAETRQMVEYAMRHNAPDGVMAALADLPQRLFPRPNDVIKALLRLK